jgi:4-carboxymuconolactone decarboxylase
MGTKEYEDGLAQRKAVLGDEYVNRSIANANDFTRPLQEWVTEHCWGTVWTRPGLSHKTRSLVNIGMLCALNRSHELAIHVQGALNNGCTQEEIQEVLLQVGVYCGAPAAVEGFKIADDVIRKQEPHAR